jgi:hypothetical protein
MVIVSSAPVSAKNPADRPNYLSHQNKFLRFPFNPQSTGTGDKLRAWRNQREELSAPVQKST